MKIMEFLSGTSQFFCYHSSLDLVVHSKVKCLFNNQLIFHGILLVASYCNGMACCLVLSVVLLASTSTKS